MTIINRKKKFIFLKPRKTAGTSIELHLLKNTELGSDLYRTSRGAKKYGLNRNYKWSVFNIFDFYFYLNLPGTIRNKMPMIRGHMPASDVKKIVKKEFWEEATIVSALRNPWDNLFSYWRWNTRVKDDRLADKQVKTPFEEWAWAAISKDEKKIKEAKAKDASNLLHKFLFIEGELVTDFCIRFENINESFKKLSELTGVEIPPLAIHEKKTPVYDYRKYYSDSLAEAVGEFFSDIINFTGYSF